MKIFVDEHISLMTVQALRMMGHDVCDIRGTPDQGMQDDALWQMAQREERLLITTDKGFPQYRAVPHHRVFIIRLRRPNRHKNHHASCKRRGSFLTRNGPIYWWSCGMSRRVPGVFGRVTEPNTYSSVEDLECATGVRLASPTAAIRPAMPPSIKGSQ